LERGFLIRPGAFAEPLQAIAGALGRIPNPRSVGQAGQLIRRTLKS
jgi:hypothetical protein